MPSALPTHFGVQLPDWVASELADVPDTLPTDEDRVRIVNRLAARNHKEGTGGPFAALSLAQIGHGTWDLGASGGPALELVVNWRTCVMCYGAAMWSGVRRLLIAGHGPEAENLTGFDEGPMREDWIEQFDQRGIEVVTDVLRDEAVDVLRDYGRRPDVVVYNARGRGSRHSELRPRGTPLPEMISLVRFGPWRTTNPHARHGCWTPRPRPYSSSRRSTSAGW
ncbi:nucleoside deaminase [Streptomyces sp. NPDC091217]|uniref:nucleoside deaminase n=1 Tax=Streptomyces sp. NPDC091217 TaxID=3365975 RepID=UPI003823CE1D